MALVTPAREVTAAAARQIWHSQVWVWLLPFAVFYAVQSQPQSLIRLACAAPIAIGLVAFVAARPVAGTVTMIALLPFHIWILAGLYRVGFPAEVLKPLAYWKELIAAGVVVAALRKARDEGRRLDWLDWAAFAYLGVVAAYMIFPRLLVPASSWYILGAPTDRTVRLIAARNDAMFVVLLLALRHLRLPGAGLERIAGVVLRVGLVVAGIGVVEFFFTGFFDQVVREHLAVFDYQNQVLGAFVNPARDFHLYGYVGDQSFLRVGSVLLSPLSLGFLLVLPFAVAVERLTRRTEPAAVAAVALLAFAILLTQTRSAALAAIIAAALAVRRQPGRRQSARIHFMLVGAALLVVAVPVAGSTGFTDRVEAAAGGTDSSAQTHWESTYWGFRILVGQPWGRGLGTAPGIGHRFQIEGKYTSENYYLQVGNEIGVIAMVAFIAVVLVAGRRTLRAAQRLGSSVLPAATSGAFIGLSVGGLLLHVWNDLPTSWMVWAALGASIGAAEASGGGGGPPATDRVPHPVEYSRRPALG